MSLREKALSAPGAVLLGGLVFWAMAWFIDFWTHVEVFGVGAGAHAHGGDALVRVNFPLTGAPLILFGMAQLMGTDALLKRGGLPLLAASFLFMLDGLAHAFSFNDHLGEPAAAAFFALVAPAQIAVGAAMPFLPRRFDRWLVAAALGLLALYTASRSLSFPPLGWPEPVEELDVFSKVVEVLFILVVLAGVRRGPAPSGRRAAPRTASGAAAGSAGEP